MAKSSLAAVGIIDYRLVGISSKARLSTAVDLMRNTSVGIMPVVEGEKLVGVLDERSLLEYVKANKDALLAGTVSDAMQPPFFIVVNASIDEAMDYIISHGVSRVPVVDTPQDMNCIGMVSATEILSFKLKGKK
ncbi:MAG: CBS domain-containing protein [Candidatus Micrarchaeia archaeon]